MKRSLSDYGLATAWGLAGFAQPTSEVWRPSRAEQRVCTAKLSSKDDLMLVQPLVTVLIQVTPTKELSCPSDRSCTTAFWWKTRSRASQQTPTYSNPTTIPLPQPSCKCRKALLVKKGGGKKSSGFSHKYYHSPSSAEKLPVGRIQRFNDNITQHPARFSFAPRREAASHGYAAGNLGGGFPMRVTSNSLVRIFCSI